MPLSTLHIDARPNPGGNDEIAVRFDLGARRHERPGGAGRPRAARRAPGPRPLLGVVQHGSAAEVRARRGAAAFLLVREGGRRVQGRGHRRFDVRDGVLGAGDGAAAPAVDATGAGRARGWPRGGGPGACSRQDAARAPTEAVRQATAAAGIEDVTQKHPVTLGAVLPVRELLGDLLLELNRPADAARAYEASLRQAPGRARSLFGLARAAEQAGDITTARARYREFLDLMAKADGDRPELSVAREPCPGVRLRRAGRSDRQTRRLRLQRRPV